MYLQRTTLSAIHSKYTSEAFVSEEKGWKVFNPPPPPPRDYIIRNQAKNTLSEGFRYLKNQTSFD